MIGSFFVSRLSRALVCGALAFLSHAVLAQEEPVDPDSVFPVVSYRITGERLREAFFGSGDPVVNVVAAEFNGSRTAADFVRSFAPPEKVSILVPDAGSGSAERAEFTTVARNARTEGIQELKAPASMSEWFRERKGRISVFVIEWAVTATLRSTEMIVSGMPISHSAAIFTGIVTGFAVASVQWNLMRLNAFVTKPGNRSQAFFGKLSATFKNPRIVKSVDEALRMAWGYFKNTGVNLAFFGLLKVMLYSTVDERGNLDFSVIEGFRRVVELSLKDTALLALQATAVAYPTSLAIGAYIERGKLRLALDSHGFKRVVLNATVVASLGLFMRGILFSSIQNADRLHYVDLSNASWAALELMMAGSGVWYLFNRFPKVFFRERSCREMMRE